MEFLWSSYGVPSGQRREKVGTRSGEGRVRVPRIEIRGYRCPFNFHRVKSVVIGLDTPWGNRFLSSA